MDITIEALEALAVEFTAEVDNKRARLARLCVAYARIIAAREPQHYRVQPCHQGDEPGYWDSSYPPKQVYSDHTGPRSLEIASEQTEDIATSGGAYYEWRRVTSVPGLYIAPDGSWYRSYQEGTGQVGSFAAHPGHCSVDCEIEYVETGWESLTQDELVAAEEQLRELAFPLIAGREGNNL